MSQAPRCSHGKPERGISCKKCSDVRKGEAMIRNWQEEKLRKNLIEALQAYSDFHNKHAKL